MWQTKLGGGGGGGGMSCLAYVMFSREVVSNIQGGFAPP